MRIYLAGMATNAKVGDRAFTAAMYPHLLDSYYYLALKKSGERLEFYRGVPIFLDSGAFSAYTKGVNIGIEEYGRYIVENKTAIELAANLDDISDDREKGAKNSAANQKRLEGLTRGSGIRVIPVFHAREDTKWLKALLDKHDHIALGGMVPESTAWLRVWLDELFTRFLCDSKGRPRLKVHGFGLTTFELMLRYPFFSVDSTSWILAARFGSIFFPVEEGTSIITIHISDQSPRRREWDAHFDTLAPVVKQKVEDFIVKMGFVSEELRTIYWKRDLFNIAVLRLMNNAPPRPFRRQTASLFI